MKWWNVAQTVVAVSAVGYAAYLWYDNWREEREEVSVSFIRFYAEYLTCCSILHNTFYAILVINMNREINAILDLKCQISTTAVLIKNM